jgi:hypothetical protein
MLMHERLTFAGTRTRAEEVGAGTLGTMPKVPEGASSAAEALELRPHAVSISPKTPPMVQTSPSRKIGRAYIIPCDKGLTLRADS